jgi:hypothetical protein
MAMDTTIRTVQGAGEARMIAQCSQVGLTDTNKEVAE